MLKRLFSLALTIIFICSALPLASAAPRKEKIDSVGWSVTQLKAEDILPAANTRIEDLVPGISHDLTNAGDIKIRGIGDPVTGKTYTFTTDPGNKKMDETTYADTLLINGVRAWADGSSGLAFPSINVRVKDERVDIKADSSYDEDYSFPGLKYPLSLPPGYLLEEGSNKAPIPTFGSPQPLGQRFGLSGMILICGLIEKDCGLIILDSLGRYIGSVTRQQVKQDPDRTQKLLTAAEWQSRRNFTYDINTGLGLGARFKPTYGGPLADPLTGLNRLLKPSRTTLRSWLYDAYDEEDYLLDIEEKLERNIAQVRGALSQQNVQADPQLKSFLENSLARAQAALEDIDEELDWLDWEIMDLEDALGPVFKLPRETALPDDLTFELDLKLKLGGGMTYVSPPQTAFGKKLLEQGAGATPEVDSVVDELTNPADPQVQAAELDQKIGDLEKKIAKDTKALSKIKDDPKSDWDDIGRDTLNNTIDADSKRLESLKKQRAKLVKPVAPGKPGSKPMGAYDAGSIFNERVRLNLDTSFTGQDQLRTKVEGTSQLTFGIPTGSLKSGQDRGFKLDMGQIRPRLSFDTSFTGEDRLKTRLESFTPSGAMVPQLGLSQADINSLASDLNNDIFGKRAKCLKNCFTIYAGRPQIYIIETIFGRVVLKKKKTAAEEVPVVPNDPLFQHQEKKKKKLFGILGSSSSISMDSRGRFGASTGVRLGSKSKAEAKDQWGLHAIGYTDRSSADSAWNIIDGQPGPNVLVAVIDSGLDMTHPDGPAYIWTNTGEIPDNGVDDDSNGYVDDVHGWNFLAENNDITDDKGHGTFVAGIIAAKTGNQEGIAGINPGAQILPLKVADKEGQANSLNIFRAIHYAVEQGARVINISLGGKQLSQLEQLAINYAYSRGAFIVVASGNTGEYFADIGPAGARRVFAVGAVDKDMLRSTISTVGPNNALMAPGEEIWSLRSQNSYHPRAIKDEFARLYFTQSGTSFSAPMVAATASLMILKNPRLTNDQIENILMATATDMDDPGWDDMTGAGLLNAAQALRNTGSNYPLVKLHELRVNNDKRDGFQSVDVIATVRGDFESFTLGVGKGQRAKKFTDVAGPFKRQAEYSWIARINKKDLRGSTNWVVQLKALDKDGNATTATAALDLKRQTR